MKVINPFDSKTIGEITLLSRKEALQKVKNAVGAKQKMRQLSAGDKSTILNQIIEGIQDHFDDFVNTIVLESGKPYRYAKGEVNRAIATFKVAAEECKRLPHELIDIDATENGRHLKGEVVYFPRGVVFGISPFNFPLNLAVHKIAPAIASACPILLKPSSKTPLTMELLFKVIQSTDLPQGGFELIHCSREVGDELIAHPSIDVLSFTGSPDVGWAMKAKAEKKHVVLELGGNAAAIIGKDASLKLAIDELLVGGFAYSGQVCIHTQRIYVHESLMEEFVSTYVSRVEEFEIGDPLSPSTEFGVMIDEANAKRVESWVSEALEAGAECLVGGSRVGAFYAPTVLINVPKGQKVRDEEVFGPVVMIESFASIDDAIQEVNDCRWGLQSSIFTDSIEVRNKVFNQLNVGSVIHNKSTTFRVDDMPYGGVKDSGFGREGVKYAMLDFLEPKLLVRE